MSEFLAVIGNSITAPRRAVRILQASSDAGVSRVQLLLIAAAATLLASLVFTWLPLRDETNPEEFAYFGPGKAGWEAITEGLLGATLVLVSYPFGIWIWRNLLGFKNQAESVRNAAAVGLALSTVMTVGFELLHSVLKALGLSSLEMVPVGMMLVASIIYTTIYYSESLGISFGVALRKNIVASILVGLLFAIPIGVIVFVSVLAEAPNAMLLVGGTL